MQNRRFEFSVCVVTGAASGIGRATAEQYLREGGSVVAVDLDEEKLNWVGEYANASAVGGDITEVDTNETMVNTAIDRYGRLDGLVLNAGLPATGKIDEVPMDVFDRVIDVNLRAVVLGLRAALPHLKTAGGSVVVTASVSGLGGDTLMWPYNAAKGGVVNLVRACAIDLAQYDIRVNAVCPGPIKTGMTAEINKIDEIREGLRSRIPLQRWGEPEEVGEVINFLLSGGASFVNGAIIPVDGGVSANTSQFLPPS